jgi:hypothetical protein
MPPPQLHEVHDERFVVIARQRRGRGLLSTVARLGVGRPASRGARSDT